MSDDKTTTASEENWGDKSLTHSDAFGHIHPEPQTSLARRIARRTTDLLAISLILIGGLTVTRRIIIWWKTDPQQVAPGVHSEFAPEVLAPWSSHASGSLLDFGTMPFSLRRWQIAGDLETALDHMQQHLRKLLTVPMRAEDIPQETPAEAKLLEGILAIDPVEGDPHGQWWIYRLPGTLNMVLGVKLVDEKRRIAAWGLLFPVTEEYWTLISVEPRSAVASDDEQSPLLPIPPETVPTLSLRDPLAGAIVSFRGKGPPAVWRKHFDTSAKEAGWTRGEAPQTSSEGGALTYLKTVGEKRFRVDVQFVSSKDHWTGVMQMTRLKTK